MPRKEIMWTITKGPKKNLQNTQLVIVFIKFWTTLTVSTITQKVFWYEVSVKICGKLTSGSVQLFLRGKITQTKAEWTYRWTEETNDLCFTRFQPYMIDLLISPKRQTAVSFCTHTLRPVHAERLRLRLQLTPMMDENAFYIKLYRKSQTQTLGVNRPLVPY